MFPHPAPLLTVTALTAGGGGGSIAFVGAKVAGYATTDSSTSLTDLLDSTGSNPTLQTGDLVIFTCTKATSLSTDLAQSALLPTDPSAAAYTAAHTDLWSSDNTSTNLQVSYKFMGATPDTSVNLPTYASTSDNACYHILVLRGVNTTNPLDVTPTTASGEFNTNKADPPAINPSTAGAVVSCHGGGGWASSPSAYTKPAELSSTTNHWLAALRDQGGAVRRSLIGVGIHTGWTSGAFDCSAFGGGNASASTSYAAVTIAWRPA